ncbi:MAG: helicase associated domain-containing protein [Bacteroidota bacterium]
MKKKKQSPDFFSSADTKKRRRKTRQTIVPNYNTTTFESRKIVWRKHPLWHEHYAQLSDFKKRFGHCMVPNNWDENPLLANWVHYQRHRASTLSIEKYQLLDKLGFEWDNQEYRWMSFYYKLREYRKTFGSCIVSETSPEYKSLANWITRQRTQKRWFSPGLTAEHIRLLDGLSFDWTYRKNRKKPPEQLTGG